MRERTDYNQLVGIDLHGLPELYELEYTFEYEYDFKGAVGLVYDLLIEGEERIGQEEIPDRWREELTRRFPEYNFDDEKKWHAMECSGAGRIFGRLEEYCPITHAWNWLLWKEIFKYEGYD